MKPRTRRTLIVVASILGGLLVLIPGCVIFTIQQRTLPASWTPGCDELSTAWVVLGSPTPLGLRPRLPQTWVQVGDEMLALVEADPELAVTGADPPPLGTRLWARRGETEVWSEPLPNAEIVGMTSAQGQNWLLVRRLGVDAPRLLIPLDPVTLAAGPPAPLPVEAVGGPRTMIGANDGTLLILLRGSKSQATCLRFEPATGNFDPPIDVAPLGEYPRLVPGPDSSILLLSGTSALETVRALDPATGTLTTVSTHPLTTSPVRQATLPTGYAAGDTLSAADWSGVGITQETAFIAMGSTGGSTTREQLLEIAFVGYLQLLMQFDAIHLAVRNGDVWLAGPHGPQKLGGDLSMTLDCTMPMIRVYDLTADEALVIQHLSPTPSGINGRPGILRLGTLTKTSVEVDWRGWVRLPDNGNHGDLTSLSDLSLFIGEDRWYLGIDQGTIVDINASPDPWLAWTAFPPPTGLEDVPPGVVAKSLYF